MRTRTSLAAWQTGPHTSNRHGVTAAGNAGLPGRRSHAGARPLGRWADGVEASRDVVGDEG